MSFMNNNFFIPRIVIVKLAFKIGGIPLSATHSYSPASAYDIFGNFKTVSFILRKDPSRVTGTWFVLPKTKNIVKVIYKFK